LQLLDSVAVQSNRNFDLVMVVERSRELLDAISAYIKDKKYSAMSVVFNDGPQGLSAARNLGIARSQSDIVAFVDDDAVVDKDWVDQIIRTYAEDKSVIGVTGPIYPLWENKDMAWFPPEFYWIFSCTYNEPAVTVEVRNGYGTNVAFERAAFARAGLFNTDLGAKGRGRGGWQEPGAEETEISLRIKANTGKRIVFNPKIKVQHKVYAYRMTNKFITKRAYWEGYAKALLKAKRLEVQPGGRAGGNVLSTEQALLRRILFWRVPQDLRMLFSRPKTAVRRLGVVFSVLPCVAAGYCRYYLKKRPAAK
jgi:glycosyltransferase involved in cell wall biosynthesis